MNMFTYIHTLIIERMVFFNNDDILLSPPLSLMLVFRQAAGLCC
jgi:hypothetical protein